MMWTWEYDETGGHDCMTSGIDIKLDGKLIASLDRSDYDTKDNHEIEANFDMMQAAKLIINACNAYKGK